VSYYDIVVIVEGAVDQHETILSDDRNDRALNLFITDIERQAKEDGKETTVFVQFHDHGLHVDGCSCAQYEQAKFP
jgi:hypothetical protein